jgi:exonuclease III
MKQTSLTLLLLFCISLTYCAADTLRMMQYNMMYYTTSAPSDCNTSGSYMNDKDANLKTIIDYVLPDLFCVNEIGSQSTYIDRVLNNVMNTNGRNYYASCPLTNYSGGSIANMLYYDSRKLVFYSHFYVTTSPRDINAYKMYYKSEGLAHGDTAFITFIIAHLKAGSSATNAADRKVQVERLTTKLEQVGIDNYVLSGDFNLYSASEAAYQHLLFNNNTAFRFIDPIDEYGKWNNNSKFAQVHTQSTHSSAGNCFASGGLDDRFDFILVSPTVFYGTKKVEVIPSSYHALGQDGQHFNKNLTDAPTNSTIPAEVINAMYNFSDHLPVICDFEIKSTVKIEENRACFFVNVENPVKNALSIHIFAENEQSLYFEIYSIDGKRIDHFTERISSGNQTLSRKFEVAPSLYILKITNERHETIIRKLVK